MRTFLLTVFWVTNFGNVIQLLVMASASCMLDCRDSELG